MSTTDISKPSKAVVERMLIDKRVRELIASSKALKQDAFRAIDSLAEKLAREVYNMQLAIMADLGTNPTEYRDTFIDWGRVVGVGVETTVVRYARIGAMYHRPVHARVLKGKLLAFRTLDVIAQKKLTDAQMSAFGQFMISTDKQVSAAVVHKWANKTYNMPMPERRYNDDYTQRVDLATMALRLKHKPLLHGRALLGIGYGSCMDVVKIVGRAYTQQYHPDKGGNADDYERIRKAIEYLK
jgi:hypothetical protein